MERRRRLNAWGNNAESGAVGLSRVSAEIRKSDRVGSAETEKRSEIAFHLDHGIVSKGRVSAPRVTSKGDAPDRSR